MSPRILTLLLVGICALSLTCARPSRCEEQVTNELTLGPVPLIETAPLCLAEETVPQVAGARAAPDWWATFRPSVSVQCEWEPRKDDFQFTSTELAATFRFRPLFDLMPPSLTPRFSLATFDAPAGQEIPSTLYSLSLGFSWLVPLHERWALSLAITPSFSGDFENTTGDAWRLAGMAMALYNHSSTLSLGFGAVLTGRADYPVIPAAGVRWTPTPNIKVDAFFPRPKLSWLLADRGTRQTWLYLGGGFGGGTWAYQRNDGTNDVLTYRDWRVLIGLELAPPGGSGPIPSEGFRAFLEAGYVFGRCVEYDLGLPDYEPSPTFVLSAGVSF